MKNLIIIIFALVGFTSLPAQTIIDLDAPVNIREVEGAYYKDVQNFFDPYVGTWRYKEGNTEIVITLKKIERYYRHNFYTDALVGEMRYIKNGVLQFSNLSKITANAPNLGMDHDIFIQHLLKSHHRPVCTDCPTTERRVYGMFSCSSIEYRCASILLQRIAVAGQPDKIKLRIVYSENIVNTVPKPPKIQGTEFVLTKM